MEEEKKYLDYEGLQTYHTNICNIIEDNEQVTAAALDNLDDRLKEIETENPYSKQEIDDLLEPITDKLDNIEEFAEVNVQSDWNQTDSDADDYIKNKPTSMPASDVSAWAKASSKPSYTKDEIGLSNVTNDAQVKRSEMGIASGVATLDSAGKVPSSQLPSYVDDVVEYDTKSAFPTIGEGGKIYVDKSNDTSWRWSGSTYTQIKGDLTIGTTSGTAADGKVVSDHINNTNNPHGVTKAQVGLDSVVNTGDSATPVSGGTTKFTTGGAYTELAKKVDKVSGKGLSTNDYTNDEKNKLAGIEDGADANVQSDWNATTGDAFIKNKPTVVSNVSYDTTNKKITKTINGTTSDVVTSEKVVEDGGGMNLVEGYYYNKKFYKEAAHTTEITGADGRIYIDKDTNREYRWDGTKYVLLKSEVDGSFVMDSTFTYRPTAGALDVESSAVGEGGAQIECVKGNTIAWNQLVKPTTIRSQTLNGVTITNNGDGSVTLNGTSTTSFRDMILFIEDSTANQQHPYNNPTHKFYIHSYLTCHAYYNIISGQEQILLGSNLSQNAIYPKLFISTGDEFNNTVIKPILIDLTLIYGEGNEPTTAEQFEADYQKWFGKPLTYEEYDEGSIRSVEMTGIKTVGFNQYNQATSKANVVAGEEYQITGTYTSISENGATITPDAEGKFTPTTNEVTVVGGGNDTCIHLVHSGDRNGDYEPYWEHESSLPVTQLKGKLNGEGGSVVIFPDGMKKAGTAYDEIVKRGNQTVAIKRISQVDLGDITSWRKRNEDSSAIFFDTGANGAKAPSDAKGLSSYVCAQYSYVGALDDSTFRTKVDKSIANTLNVATTIIKIKDSAFDNYSVSEFKNAIRGIKLYYELATPKEYIIDDIDFPTEYPVDDYGTEEILSDSAKSLAPTLDIRYGLNATDTLRNLPSKYVSSAEEQNFTEAQKERARNNIGAASKEEFVKVKKMVEAISPKVDNDYYVDMGLPSGLLWAKRNIFTGTGNDKGFAPSEYTYDASFFSWGNKEGHNPNGTTFDYDFGSSNDGPYASTEGAKLTGNIPLSQDAARFNCGEPWRVPTATEYQELFDNCDFIDANGDVIASTTTNKLITMTSTVGIRLKSKINGNILFFPCSGVAHGTEWKFFVANGHYWSNNLASVSSGVRVYFHSGGIDIQGEDQRWYGFPIRPVM